MRPFSQKTAERLIKWYLAQPEAERWECHVEQRRRLQVVLNELRRQGGKAEPDGKMQYQAFLFGIDKRCRLHDNRRLKADEDLESVTARRIAVVKAASIAKPSPKLDRLQGDLRVVVVRLKREGLSWQKVSDFLAKFHKWRYSRGYLQKVFADVPIE